MVYNIMEALGMTVAQKIGLALLYTGTISMIVISELSFLEADIILKGTEISNCLMLIGTSVLTGSLASTTDKVKSKVEKGEKVTPEEVAEIFHTETITETNAEANNTTDTVAQGINLDVNEIVANIVKVFKDETKTNDQAKDTIKGGNNEVWQNTK